MHSGNALIPIELISTIRATSAVLCYFNTLLGASLRADEMVGFGSIGTLIAIGFRQLQYFDYN